MENQAGCFSMHLIDADGNFDADGLDNFVKHAKLEECGGSYAVVAIMGPHSSGKSTLLNHLFDTDFKEMDADSGRSPTTHGIWMARSAGTEPCTVVMDLQGSNRGEDDTAFEQQSALFALNISDIVLINMWCHDIGYGQAAHKLLLKTVFETMFKSSAIPPRARTLLFVLRDKTKTPLEKLEPLLKEDIWKIWDSVTKPKTHSDMTNIFNVQVVALPSYEVMEQQFKSEVASLRQKFSFAPDGLAGNMQEAVDASVFSSTVQQFWKSIKEKKPAVAQQIKLTTSAKMFAGLKLSSEKVELMKDSPFKSLASLASKDNARESNALYVQALCRLYDPSKMLCYLNEHVSFSFCRKEVARVLGMEDSGLDFNEYDKECGTYKREFSDFVYVLKNEFGKPKNPVLHTSEIVSILDNMSVATEDQKTQFKKLMSFYVIERFLRCGTNKTKPRMETWRLVIDLEKCWSVNWTQATFDHLHVAMTNCREWWDKCRPSQHNFTGCAPVLEAISFERIQKIRPKILDHLMLPVGKYDSKRGEFGDSLIGLVTEDIDRCPDCCTVSMDNLSLSNENNSEPGSVLVDTELVKDNQSTEEEPKDATEGSMTQNADQLEKVQVQPRPKEPKEVQEQRKSERIRNNKRKNEVASSSGATHEMEPTKTKRA